MAKRFHRPTQWAIAMIVVLFLGVIGLAVRVLSPESHSAVESFPWGVPEALNIFCGLSLAVGGFTIAGTLALVQLQIYSKIQRVSLLIGYLGFVVALTTALLEYQVPWSSFWRLWSPQAVPAGALVALILYSFVMLLEFRPRMEFLSRSQALRTGVGCLTAVATCLSAFLAALQQNSFASPLMLAPQEFSSLWVTSMLPALLLFSSLSACLALLIFIEWHESRDISVMDTSLGATSALTSVVLLVLVLRIIDVTRMHQWGSLLHIHLHDYLFGLELVLLISPALFLLIRKPDEHQLVYFSSVLLIANFLTNRTNTLITAREAVVGKSFVPTFSDTAVAIAIIAGAIALFVWITRGVPASRHEVMKSAA